MKIVITGGHFSPAYSLIQEYGSKAEFVILGRKFAYETDTSESLEYRIAHQRGIPFHVLKTGRLQRKFTLHTIPSLLKFPIGVSQAYFILRSERPDMVVTFGGYLAVPVALVAKALSIPIVVHEQTQHAGLANKCIGKIADKILISFESSRKYFPKGKTVLTGNPIRKDIFEVDQKLDIPTDKPLIYVTGGSGGSHAINVMVGKIVEMLVKKYSVIHQTGDAHEYKDYDNLCTLRDTLPDEVKQRYFVTKFVFPQHIGWVMEHADLVISRSGINTVHELIARKKPSILIPLPYGQQNEQLFNAKLIKEIGIGEYIEQKDLTSSTLYEHVETVFKNIKSYQDADISEEYYQKSAVENIIKELETLYEKTSKKRD